MKYIKKIFSYTVYLIIYIVIFIRCTKEIKTHNTTIKEYNSGNDKAKKKGWNFWGKKNKEITEDGLFVTIKNYVYGDKFFSPKRDIVKYFETENNLEKIDQFFYKVLMLKTDKKTKQKNRTKIGLIFKALYKKKIKKIGTINELEKYIQNHTENIENFKTDKSSNFITKINDEIKAANSKILQRKKAKINNTFTDQTYKEDIHLQNNIIKLLVNIRKKYRSLSSKKVNLYQAYLYIKNELKKNKNYIDAEKKKENMNIKEVMKRQIKIYYLETLVEDIDYVYSDNKEELTRNTYMNSFMKF